MNGAWPILLTLLLLPWLSGCKMFDALNATTEMNGKMDETNAFMQETLTEIRKTNDTTGKMKDTTTEMQGATEAMHEMTASMKATTEEMKRSLTLLETRKEILLAANNKYIHPVALSMLPMGKKFAEAATAEELVQSLMIWYKEISLIENAENAPAQERLHDVLVRYWAMLVVSGLAPIETIEEVIEEQIINGGRLEKYAYALLALRAEFIKTLAIEQSLFQDPFSNFGIVEEAVDYATLFEGLVSLPFAEKAVFEMEAYLGEDEDGEEIEWSSSLSLKEMAAQSNQIWQTILEKMGEEFDAERKNADPERYQQLESEIKEKLGETSSS